MRKWTNLRPQTTTVCEAEVKGEASLAERIRPKSQVSLVHTPETVLALNGGSTISKQLTLLNETAGASWLPQTKVCMNTDTEDQHQRGMSSKNLVWLKGEQKQVKSVSLFEL